MDALPSYNMIHNMLRDEIGKAREFSCVCGRAAEGWAYQHTAEIELRDKEGMVYSANLSDYAPMCAICHVTLDRIIDRPRRVDEVWVEQRTRPRPRVEPMAKLRKTDPTRYKELRRQAGLASTRVKRKCAQCSMIASAGNMSRHQSASGHSGWST